MGHCADSPAVGGARPRWYKMVCVSVLTLVPVQLSGRTILEISNLS